MRVPKLFSERLTLKAIELITVAPLALKRTNEFRNLYSLLSTGAVAASKFVLSKYECCIF